MNRRKKQHVNKKRVKNKIVETQIVFFNNHHPLRKFAYIEREKPIHINDEMKDFLDIFPIFQLTEFQENFKEHKMMRELHHFFVNF